MDKDRYLLKASIALQNEIVLDLNQWAFVKNHLEWAFVAGYEEGLKEKEKVGQESTKPTSCQPKNKLYKKSKLVFSLLFRNVEDPLKSDQ